MIALLVVSVGAAIVLMVLLIRLLRPSRLYSPSTVALRRIAVIVTVLLLAGTIQRIVFLTVEIGHLPERWEEFALIELAWAVSVGALVLGGWLLTRSSATLDRIARRERMVMTLTGTIDVAGGPDIWGLTRREREVFDVICAGTLSDRGIAEALFIAETTAATHVRNILRKAGLSNRHDLMLAGQQGLPGRE